MKGYFEYLTEDKNIINDETFADSAANIQEKIRRFSASIVSGFESIDVINNRTKDPVNVPTNLPNDKFLSFKVGQVYNYQGNNNKFTVRILDNDGKNIKIQDVNKKRQPWSISDIRKFGKEIKNVAV